MRNLLSRSATALALVACIALPARAADEGIENVDLSTDRDRMSYAIGVQFARSVQNDGVDINVAAFAQAMRDVLHDRDLALNNQELAQTMAQFSQELQAKQAQAQAKQAKASAAAGDEFRAEYAKRDDVSVTESGLMYRVIEDGEGTSPSPDDTVTVHYAGSLPNETVFDSSHDRGEPATFPVSNVIPGFREALLMMKEGAKWEVVIPPELGYGERGAGPSIPPNATLIFELELLDISGGES